MRPPASCTASVTQRCFHASHRLVTLPPSGLSQPSMLGLKPPVILTLITIASGIVLFALYARLRRGMAALLDAIGWGPFGQTALVLLVVRAILVSQRKVFRGKSFLLIWAAFAAVALVACSLVWITTMIYAWSALSPAPAVAQWMASVAAYPPAAWLLGQIHALALRRQ